MVRAAELAGCSSVVRVERNDAATITRALDRGAGGVQVPHVNHYTIVLGRSGAAAVADEIAALVTENAAPAEAHARPSG